MSDDSSSDDEVVAALIEEGERLGQTEFLPYGVILPEADLRTRRWADVASAVAQLQIDGTNTSYLVGVFVDRLGGRSVFVTDAAGTLRPWREIQYDIDRAASA